MAKKEPKLQSLEPTNKSPPWIDLPVDITSNILQRLGAVEMLESAENVCTTWRNACKDPAMWRVIHIKNIRSILPYNLEIMCRHAIDRSQGQLTDINFFYFGTDELLQYISERSTELNRLKLTGCCQISREGLTEAVVKFPNIEELHLVFMPSVLAEDIESIGQSCPKLKSFTFKNTWHWHPDKEDDDYAFAVADNMPGLRHLKLSGNKMTNDGLEAILDDCPELESLHLPECFNLDLEEGDLRKRCSEKVKDFLPPIDYTDWDGITSDDESFSDLESSDHDESAGYDDNASDDEMNDDNNTPYKETDDDDTTDNETDDDEDTTDDETDDDDDDTKEGL